MKVVIGIDSLSGPLTGIGYYTKHLVQGLLQSNDVENLKYFSHGRLKTSIELNPPGPDRKQGNQRSAAGSSLLGNLRPLASRIQVLVNIYDLITPLAAKFYLRNYGPDDVFHSPDFQYVPFPGKTVVTIPDLSTISFPTYHPKSRVVYINRHINRAISRADHIVTISDFVKREINEKLGVANDRITTIYPGIDPILCPLSQAEFKHARIHPLLDYKRYFLFLSTIEPRKNLARLLRAYKRYTDIKGTSPIPLVVVGLPGWNSAEIHRELKRQAQNGQVIYLGYVERKKVRILLAGARALLFPSLYEGFGLPVVEAMKSGTAVMTSRNSAMSEFSGDAALLIDNLDEAEMCESILRLDRDTEYLRLLEKKGLNLSHMFSWENCVEKTVCLYKSL